MTWRKPNGQLAVVQVEVHHDSSEVVPLTYELFAQVLDDLGFEQVLRPAETDET